MNSLRFGNLKSLLCIGAHCDDIEIGCGATVLRLLREQPEMRCTWVIFAGEEGRASESAAAARRFGGAEDRIHVRFHDFRASYFPSQYSAIKDTFEQLKAIAPDLILTHCLQDRHQDHALLAELTWNTFRGHSILEYEIPKFEGDLGQPNVFMTTSREDLDAKVGILTECFPSQLNRSWFTPDTFRALARIRGVESASPSGFAEAFHARKLRL